MENVNPGDEESQLFEKGRTMRDLHGKIEAALETYRSRGFNDFDLSYNEGGNDCYKLTARCRR